MVLTVMGPSVDGGDDVRDRDRVGELRLLVLDEAAVALEDSFAFCQTHLALLERQFAHGLSPHLIR
jgi:hypothetical protein